MQRDTKIFREIHALSRLSHRYIVRYYTTWVETAEPTSTAGSTVGSESESDDAMTSVPVSRDGSDSQQLVGGEFSFKVYDDSDLKNLGRRRSFSRGSFPSISFVRPSKRPKLKFKDEVAVFKDVNHSDSGSEGSDTDEIEEVDQGDDDEEEEEDAVQDDIFSNGYLGLPEIQRTMYIQMVGL